MSEILKRLCRLVFGDFLPCYVISRDPFVAVSYWEDFLANKEEFMRTTANYATVHWLFQFGWHRETPERVREVYHDLQAIHARNCRFHATFLCNSPREEELFKGHGLNAVFCHQNAFLDENRYRILPDAVKKYDAIYIARITPFKRHELAVEVKSLRLIGEYSVKETSHYEKIMKLLEHADWTRKVAGPRIYREINTARVGLCLSAEEGAMFVSAEYLLCGIPAVSTRNLGGRDTLFPPEYTITVEDTPEAVAAGVADAVRLNFKPERVREALLEKMQVHRDTFINIVQKIYDREHAERYFRDEWKRIFIHKWGIRRRVSPWTQIRRGLKRPNL